MITAIGFLVAATVGAWLRFALSYRLRWADIPVATLAVNITGSLGLGLLANATAPVVTVVGLGGLGALTTFSSFMIETHVLLMERRTITAVFYVVATVVTCVAAASTGIALAPG